MIITCTLNPAIDYHLYQDQIIKGKLNRADNFQFDLGGKGINVSKSLNQLACRSRCITLLNSKYKFFYKPLIKKIGMANFDIVKTKALTRFNVKLHARQETEINTEFKGVTGCDLFKLRQKFKHVNDRDILVFSGSSIKGELYLYDSLVSSLKVKKADIVIDIPAEFYDQVLKYHPLLIKPNQDEINDYFGITSEPESYIDYCKQLIEKGVQNIILSLGKNGSILVTNDKAYQIILPEIKTNQAVGAGDAFVAGFVYDYQLNKDITKAYMFGHATSYAYLKNKNFNLEEVNQILEQIKIQEIIA